MNKKKPNFQQLVAAINRHNIDSLRKMLAEGADPNAKRDFQYQGNITVLMCAAGIQFTAGVETLLKAGADPNVRATAGAGAGEGSTALHSAIHGSDTRPGLPDMQRSTEDDRFTITDMLLKAGADPNAVDQGTMLPLAYAARSGKYEICRRLIDSGATFKTWPSGCIPPIVAAGGGASSEGESAQECIVQLFLDLGAPVDAETSNGFTGLMGAALRGSQRVVDLFLSREADINHRSQDGSTPLICAAVYARNASCETQYQRGLQIVKFLLQAGADPTLRDAEGESAYEIASRSKRPLAAEYLKRYLITK